MIQLATIINILPLEREESLELEELDVSVLFLVRILEGAEGMEGSNIKNRDKHWKTLV